MEAAEGTIYHFGIDIISNLLDPAGVSYSVEAHYIECPPLAAVTTQDPAALTQKLYFFG